MNPPEDRQSPEYGQSPDPIDALIRGQNTYVDDDGFTRRVMAALPRRRRAWLRPIVLVGSTAVGWVLSILWLPWKSLPAVDLSALRSLDPQVLTPWALVLTVAVSLIWAMLAAVHGEE